MYLEKTLYWQKKVFGIAQLKSFFIIFCLYLYYIIHIADFFEILLPLLDNKKKKQNKSKAFYIHGHIWRSTGNIKYNISVIIFTFVLKIFVAIIKNNPNIQGINNSRYVYLHSVYADDCTFSLEDKNSVIEVQKQLNIFQNFKIKIFLKVTHLVLVTKLHNPTTEYLSTLSGREKTKIKAWKKL